MHVRMPGRDEIHVARMHASVRSGMEYRADMYLCLMAFRESSDMRRTRGALHGACDFFTVHTCSDIHGAMRASVRS